MGFNSTHVWSTLNNNSPKNKDKNFKNQQCFDSEKHVQGIVDQTLKEVEYNKDFYSQTVAKALKMINEIDNNLKPKYTMAEAMEIMKNEAATPLNKKSKVARQKSAIERLYRQPNNSGQSPDTKTKQKIVQQ